MKYFFSRVVPVSSLVAATLIAGCSSEDTTSPLEIAFPSEKSKVASDTLEVRFYPNTVLCSKLMGTIVGGSWRSAAGPLETRQAATCAFDALEAPTLPFGTYTVLAVAQGEGKEYLAGCTTFVSGAETVAATTADGALTTRAQQLQLFPVYDPSGYSPNADRSARCVLAAYCAAQNPCR